MTNTCPVIAVGFDGSASSEVATRWALEFALRLEADVVLVHAVGILEHLAREAVTEQFASAVHVIANVVGYDETHLQWHVDNGDPCSVLLRVAQAPISAALLVVGSRGKGARAGHLLGSTSLQLAERSPVPVVIVPADTKNGENVVR